MCEIFVDRSCYSLINILEPKWSSQHWALFSIGFEPAKNTHKNFWNGSLVSPLPSRGQCTRAACPTTTGTRSGCTYFEIIEIHCGWHTECTLTDHSWHWKNTTHTGHLNLHWVYAHFKGCTPQLPRHPPQKKSISHLRELLLWRTLPSSHGSRTRRETNPSIARHVVGDLKIAWARLCVILPGCTCIHIYCSLLPSCSFISRSTQGRSICLQSRWTCQKRAAEEEENAGSIPALRGGAAVDSSSDDSSSEVVLHTFCLHTYRETFPLRARSNLFVDNPYKHTGGRKGRIVCADGACAAQKVSIPLIFDRRVISISPIFELSLRCLFDCCKFSILTCACNP